MNIVLINNHLNTSFEIDEVLQCAKRYDKVVVMLVAEPKNLPVLPANVVLDFKTLQPNGSWKLFFLLNWVSILNVWLSEPNRGDIKKSLKDGIHLLSISRQEAKKIYKCLSQRGLNTRNTVISSFWFYNVQTLAWLKKMVWKGALVSRAHGGDIYEERGSINTKALFRHFELNNLDKVLSVSEAGTQYLRSRYPKFKDKIKTQYLGSEDNGIASCSNSQQLHLVTCAHGRNVKRLYLLAECLQRVDFAIKWTHLGGAQKNDPTYKRHQQAIKVLSQNQWVEFEDLGEIPSDKIHHFYQNNSVDLFVSVSENEGIPVSMMEAISYGIPVLATDVGGCKEIVTEQTGILIPKEFSQNEVLKTLKDFKNSGRNTVEFRKGVREFWKANFDIESNYKKYYQELGRLKRIKN